MKKSVNLFTNLDTLINTINSTNFNKNTLKANKNNSISVTKSKGFWGGRAVKPAVFNRAVKLFSDAVQLHLNELNEKNLHSALHKLQKHVQELSNNSNKKTEYNPAFDSLSKLTHKIALYHWNKSNEPMTSVISKLDLREIEKKELIEDCLDKKGKLYLSNTLLLISKSFLENNQANIKKRLETAFLDNPSILTIQMQGSEQEIDVELLKKLIKNDLPLKKVLPSFIFHFIAQEKQHQLTIHPELFLKSSFFFNSLDFEENFSKDQAPVHIPISFKTMELLNKGQISSIEISSKNLNELLTAADFFAIPELLIKCDKFLCNKFLKTIKALNRDLIFEYVVENYQCARRYNLSRLKILSGKNFGINYPLNELKDKENLITKLQILNDKKIFIKSLNLSNSNEIDDEVLKKISTLQPEIVSLKINHSTVGDLKILSELKKLKHLEMRKIQLKMQPFYKILERSADVASALSLCKNLKYLDISDNEFTDDIGLAFPELLNLESLHIENNICSDEIGPQLSLLKNLQYLNINLNMITDEIGPELAKLTNLIYLDISRNERWITDMIGPFLAQLENLEYIKLPINEHTDRIKQHLINLKNLKL